MTQAQGVDADLVPTEADIDEEVVMAIAHQDDLDADDLEIIETEPGKQVVRIKSSRKEAIKAAREKKRHGNGWCSTQVIWTPFQYIMAEIILIISSLYFWSSVNHLLAWAWTI